MEAVQTTSHSASAEAWAHLARDILRRTGVAVTLFGPDGSDAFSEQSEKAPDPSQRREKASDPADFPLAMLAREAHERNEDRLEVGTGCMRAAWPIRLRSRTVLTAAAEIPVAGEEGISMGRRLLAAVGEAVRARLEGAVARSECDEASASLLQSFEEVSLLHQLGEVLRVNRSVEELLEYVCGELRDTVDAESAVAYLPEADGDSPETIVAGQLPFPAADLPRIVAHLMNEVGPEQSVLINNYCQDDPVLAEAAPSLARAVLVPVPMREGLRGALAAFNHTDGEFGSPDAKLIRSAASASAIFIENRRLYRDLQALMIDLVRALVSSVDAKDPYTCGHSERVAIMARRIAIQMRMPSEDVEQVYLAGLLHDIGKIGTPESILCKEGRLEPAEWLIIQRHPEVGSRILAGIRRLEAIRGAVLYHHERIDGKGYPSGIKGDEIPLLARIVGLADAFDAMTSNRPYRPMMPLEQVKREIQRNIGTQFDVQAAEALLGLNMNQLMRELVERPTVASIK